MENTQSIEEKARQYVMEEEFPEFRNEIESLLLTKDMEELNDRFYTELRFGTGGMRGIIGGGYNRINPYNIRKTTQGLANYINSLNRLNPSSVVIAYDSRRFSRNFLEAGKVLCGNGIKTYIFTSLRPTPELSFAVRQMQATAGIVITASHNPPEYNGYKVYWEDGGQIVAPHDKGIMEKVGSVSEVTAISEEESVNRGLLVFIDNEMDKAYVDTVKGQALRKELIRKKGSELTVVYTPLHGTGGKTVVRVLEELGFQVTVVPEQIEPNEDFPTVKSPNPEESSALAMAIELGKKVGADLVMGTDPDSDRLGIAVPSQKGFALITGNQLGALLTDYIFSTRAELKSLPAKPAFVNTIVTTDLQKKIAEEFGASCFETLTGFKYIADMIRRFEENSTGLEFVFGGEESYGYLVGSSVRDKDAVSAAAMTAEMALYHVSNGNSLLDRLDQIYMRYGYYEELLVSAAFEGEKGFRQMNDLMQAFRDSPPAELAGEKVVQMIDYKTGKTRNVVSGKEVRDIDLPPSDVLQFFLADDSKVTVRPSGTEPKMKFYASCRREAGNDLGIARRLAHEMVENIERTVRAILADQT